MRTFVLLGLALTGCLANPAHGVTDTGAPATLVIRSGTGTVDVQVEDGRSTTTNSDGSSSETVNYKTVQEQYRWKNWGFYQGPVELDEQDWFGLRDPRASAEIAEARRKAYREQSIGLPLAIAGYAGMFGTQFVAGLDSSGARVAYIGGAVAATIGTLLYTKGLLTMRNKTLLPMSRAYAAADRVSHCEDGRCVTLKGQPAADETPRRRRHRRR